MKLKKTTIFFLTCIFILLLPENVLAASPLYIWPTESHSLSRNFNEHSKKAIDISVSSGELVYASRSGKVINVFTGCNNHSGIKNGTCEKRGLCNPSSASYNSSGFCNSGFGNGLIIKHDDGTYAHYAHMSTVHVSEGQTVKQGDVVGTSGDSGNCNGPCLHFELRSKNVSAYKGTPIDPLTVFNNEPSISVLTKDAKSISEDSATLYGSVSATGINVTEVGMYFGKSESNLAKLGSDTVNTYSTNMWYNTTKYGKILEPGSTYYYRAYAIAGGKTYYGSIKTFSTLPGANTVSGSIGLSQSALTIQDNVCCSLTATVSPAGQKVTWKSSDSSVATVKDGMVSGVRAGTATITASMTYNGVTYSATCKVTVTSSEASSTVSVTVSGASNITASSVRLDGSCSYTGTRPSSVGVYMGTSSGNMTKWGSDSINHNKNPFDIWYNLSGLSAGTTYYYKFYAIVNGKEVVSSTKSFTTKNAEASSTASVTVSGASNITASSVRLDGSCSYTGTRPSSVGVYMGTSSGNMTKWGSDSINHNKNPFDIWYNLSGLSAGTTYYYKFYAIVNGKEVVSSTKSFTTTPVATENIRIGIVSGTGSSYLAINDAPASSSSGQSTQIGRIPPGGTCKVNLNKTSGNWYWVEYNGVSGYAYSKYITLQ